MMLTCVFCWPNFTPQFPVYGREPIMSTSVLVQEIVSANSCFTEMFEDWGEIFMSLNPVSCLAALKSKDLFSTFLKSV